MSIAMLHIKIELTKKFFVIENNCDILDMPSLDRSYLIKCNSYKLWR